MHRNRLIDRRPPAWPAAASQDRFALVRGEDVLSRYASGSGHNRHDVRRHGDARLFGAGNDALIGPLDGLDLAGRHHMDSAILVAMQIVHGDGLRDRSPPPAINTHP